MTLFRPDTEGLRDKDGWRKTHTSHVYISNVAFKQKVRRQLYLYYLSNSRDSATSIVLKCLLQVITEQFVKLLPVDSH